MSVYVVLNPLELKKNIKKMCKIGTRWKAPWQKPQGEKPRDKSPQVKS